jgi:hypothetical protein
MKFLDIMSTLYLFLVALVITFGILMIILFFSLFNRNEDSSMNYNAPNNEDIELINK